MRPILKMYLVLSCFVGLTTVLMLFKLRNTLRQNMLDRMSRVQSVPQFEEAPHAHGDMNYSTNATETEMGKIVSLIERGWTFNHEELMKLRTKLAVIHTRDDFTLTRKNTPLHSVVPFTSDKYKRKRNVTEDLYNTLPQEPPDFQTKRFKNCSVVGSSGILSRSGCGPQIDSSEFIFRFNLPPLVKQYTGDVGKRTDLVTCNRHRLSKRLSKLDSSKDRKLFKGILNGQFPNLSYIWLFPFSVLSDVKNILSFPDILEKIGSPVKAVFSNPRYSIRSKRFWQKNGVKETLMTSGFTFVSFALEVCDEVHVYGFWPYLVDRRGNEIGYHYTDDNHYGRGLTTRGHKMPREFAKLLDMYKKGVLRLVTDKCLA
ncbi:ST8SIA5 [Branchiostoma lanceolatum]|uniref:ST8SIA5 protein n=1 Tax=Branchiostoma lanceolatum TaxID=7740 RepID=A0A8J9Z8F0_BRALA|nr:ST8SIA5 [Branchiostoma lanceolatum]